MRKIVGLLIITSLCAAFQRLGEQFPNASRTVKSRAQAEKTRLNCK